MAKKCKLIDCIEDSASRQLVSVSYNLNEDAITDKSDDLTILLSDRIDKILTENDSMSCEVTREVRTSPQSILSISVTAKLYLNVKTKYSGKMKWDEIDIEKELSGSCRGFFSDPMSRISLIIANITSSFAGLPMITPDSLIISDEGE
ncbi:MAG: hypothetical protein LBJ91_01655 [Clostridiales Family XIII bacterium]|jgi:hypothetical protein|nr:hypothetical protein [Clostridiales Family XIII bacterium]